MQTATVEEVQAQPADLLAQLGENQELIMLALRLIQSDNHKIRFSLA